MELSRNTEQSSVLTNRSTIEHLFSLWSLEDSNLALQEGWCLTVCNDTQPVFECHKAGMPGSLFKEKSIEVPDLDSDERAMVVLYEGTQPHHVLAKKLLQEYASAKWLLFLEIVERKGGAYPPTK